MATPLHNIQKERFWGSLHQKLYNTRVGSCYWTESDDMSGVWTGRDLCTMSHCEANQLNSKGEVNVSDIPGPLLQSGVSHAMFLSKFV